MLKINYQLKMQNYNIVNLYDSIIKENMYAWGINKGGCLCAPICASILS